MSNELTSIVDRFSERRILVVGDLILDHYLEGDVGRISPEAPVPVLAVEKEDWLPGGAANVAKNIVTAGARVTLAGMRGQDESGEVLERILAAIPGMEPQLIAAPDRPTTVKTRAVARGQQMLRLDRERSSPASRETVDQLRELILPAIKDYHAVVLSDYGKGLLNREFNQEVAATARAFGIPVLVDPKGADYTRYAGATAITPNQKEASEASGVAIRDHTSCARAAAAIQQQVGGECVVITRGPSGVSVFPKGAGATHIAARAREVFDVTGAGDTFIAIFSLALACGADYARAAELGNIAGGYVVGLSGVAAISGEVLRNLIETGGKRQKLLPAGELEQICRSLRQNGAKVVFTNGFFDLLHYSHILLLERARGMGQALIVAINSDESTRRLRGKPRPILSVQERAGILASLPFVDYVTVFDEDTPEALLRQLQPAILVKGKPAEGPLPEVVGREIIEAQGGEVRFVEIEGMTSTSALLQRAERG